MSLLQNEVICITGASRGVGECLAHCLAENGAKKLILVAEDEQGLKTASWAWTADKAKSAGAKDVETHICDLADAKAVQALGDKLAGMGVTCLINNAGVFLGGEDDPLKAGQGAVAPEDVAEAVLLPFRCSANCVPEEIVLKAAQPGNA
ncbi:acetoin dehydrogenase [Chlorella sorokiniana]|uniref:Acetoin dehydrogenase n=1 Tax=Chlorella sorokiniana TaxID=3076 RepID=A0A2P6U0T8_CHLSO|nr:acetoin dehydrogenase [Chlorella sorokiniana]|eukprot:PRW59908.1 acetoin dehydrogenase [Chlorella sorokiniana]